MKEMTEQVMRGDYETVVEENGKTYRIIMSGGFLHSPDEIGEYHPENGPSFKDREKYELVEEDGMRYRVMNGLLYPEIETMEDIPRSSLGFEKLGRYGRMAEEYMKENYPYRYEELWCAREIVNVLQEVEKEAKELIDRMDESFWKKHKEEANGDFMKTVRLKNMGHMMAERAAIEQIINQYH